MARSASSQGLQNRCSTSLKQAKQPQGIRRSARLQKRLTPEQVYRSLIAHDNNDPPTQLPLVTTTQPTAPKRKRSREIDTSDQSTQKRQRQASTLFEDERFKIHVYTVKDAPTSNTKDSSPISYWARHQQWPQNLFKPEGNMNNFLAQKKSTSTLRRKSSASSISLSSTALTPSDQRPREAKSYPYARKNYATVLATKGSFMGRFELGITDRSKRLCQTLLDAEQSVPQDTSFRDDLFEETCESVQARNEALVIREISPLICPPAQALRVYGARYFKLLNESANEGWNNAIPIYGPRPQPDHSVGFRRSAFTDSQLKRLEPFVGKVTDDFTSYFMATSLMYFPFLTCEVKCGAASLDIADRQNAHSMTVAVRAVVELFRLVKRENEIDREILAFSISHDDHIVRIYGHYPVINGKETTFYRHPIHEFSFIALDGKDRWTAYKFTKNVYDNWMPGHLERLCSVINEIPLDISFDISQDSELQSSQTGLSQELESNHLSLLETSPSVASWDGAADVRYTTSNTSHSEQSPLVKAAHTWHMPPPGPIVRQKRARQDGGADSQHVQSLESDVALLREEKRLFEKEQKEKALRKELEELQEWKRSLAIE